MAVSAFAEEHESGGQRPPPSVASVPALRARPDQRKPAFILFNQAGVERGREGRIVELNRVVGPAGALGDLRPGRAHLRPACEDPVGRRLWTGLVFVREEGQRCIDVEGLDLAQELAVFFGEGADGRHNFTLRVARGRQSASMAR